MTHTCPTRPSSHLRERKKERNGMAFELPPLPYAQDALEPHCSAKTLSFHHGQHHQAYVSKTNELIAGTEHADKYLEDIIKSSSGTLFQIGKASCGEGVCPYV